MDQMPQPQNSNNTEVPPIPTPQPQNNGFKQGQITGNQTEQRAKRRIYSFIQIIATVFLLISCPFIIISLIEIGPQFGKTAKNTALIKEITTDIGGVIDKSTGITELSNGCQVFYSFTVDEKVYEGSAHSTTLCSEPIDTVINIVHNPTTPIDNTIDIPWQPYDTYLITGSILLVSSLIVVIGSSVLKSKIPKPTKNKYILI